MGLILSCITGSMSSMACCFTQAACRMCCSSLPKMKYSTATRFGYALFLSVGVAISYITKADFVKKLMVKIPSLCKGLTEDECSANISEEAIFRIWMSYSVFFVIMALFTIDVRTSKDIRAMFNTGFWIFKVLIIISLVVAFTFVPIASKFSYVVFIIALIGAFLFILHQLLIFIDFLYIWNETWLENLDDTKNQAWFGALLTFTVLFFLFSMSLIVVMFVFYTKSTEFSCHVNKTILSFQMLMSILVSCLSSLPFIQEHVPSSGLLQSSGVSAYTSFLIYSAVNQDLSSCNSFSHHRTTLTVVLSVISAIFSVILIVYNAVADTKIAETRIGGVQSGDIVDVHDSIPDGTHEVGRKGQEVYDNEVDGVTYSYSLFHAGLVCASLYLMMIISTWYNPKSLTSGSLSAMWVKFSSSWFCFLLYIWTLVAPLIFPDRDFGYNTTN